MKKLLALLIICFIALSGCAQTKNNYNLDFEEINSGTGLPVGWGMGNIKSSDIPNDSTLKAYKADASMAQHGKYSLLIDWTIPYDEWTASVYCIPKTFAGHKIRLQAI